MGWESGLLTSLESGGVLALGLLSFTEAIIQPIPPDLLYIPMLASSMGNVPRVLLLWLVVTLTSVAGSVVGAWIGKRWGRPLLERFSAEHHVGKLDALMERYGTFGVFIAAFSPIPYKVFAWVAGMGEMEARPFILAGLAGRSLRFGLEALLIGIYGQRAIDSIMWFLDNEIMLAILIIVGFAICWVFWQWWRGIGSDAENGSQTTDASAE